MSPLLNSDPSFAARFKREARIVAQLSHASIVPVFDVGEHHSHHYLSMEYLPGGDLKRRILQGGGDLSLALNVCTALSTALDLAHRKGFVHRDIKPGNILFRGDGTPVLTDFGIARVLDNGGSMTVAGMLVGTPSYMSPEQVKGLELDGRSDLYSIGIVFFEILTGAVPFKADSTLSTALKHVSDPLPPLPSRYTAYQEFLDCLTAKDRNERFASGAEVIRALRVIGTGRMARNQMLMGIPGQVELADEHGESVGRSPGPAGAASDVMTARSGPSASPRKPIAARAPRRASAWRALAEPARARQLLLGAAVVVVALVVVGTLFKIASPDKGAGSSKPNGPALAAHQEAPATSESGGSQAAAEGAKTSVSGDQHVIEQVGSVAVPAATPETAASATASDTTELRSAASQTSPSSPAAQLPPSSGALVTSPVAADGTRSQVSSGGKRLTEEQRQRKEEDARLIAQHAAKLRATQLQAQEAHIQELLTAAKNEYDAGALWRPSGASAADHYREILKLQPGRAEAVAGALRVANVLASEAEHSEAAGDIYTSRLLVDQIQLLQPDHQKLGELRARLEQLVASPMTLNPRDRARLEKAVKYIARAEEDLGHQPLDYRAATDAVEQYDKAVFAAALAPGLPSLKERLIAVWAVAVRTELGNNDSKRAVKLINLAHKHNWASEDLDQLEASIQSNGTPTTAIKEAGAQ
jgi:hypothetical protein